MLCNKQKKWKLTTLLTAVAVLLLAMAPGTVGGAVIYVDDDATGANDGSSWANAYNYLQDALCDALRAGGVPLEIWVAAGTYKPDAKTEPPSPTPPPLDRTATFQLVNNVAIYGGFAGTEDPATFNLDDRDFVTNETIISGDIGLADVNADNSYHVVTASGTDATAVLDGFTITAGNADGSDGGGMYNYYGSSPTVTNCIFTGNSAEHGGGIYNYYGSSPTVTNCTFSGNSSIYRGGAMDNYNDSSPTVTNCTFSGNSSIFYGGAISNLLRSNTALTNCTFSGNSSNYYGGAVSNVRSNATLTNCTFTGNSAGQGGGGLYIFESAPTLANNIISGNSALPAGGGLLLDNSSPTLIGNTITGNVADYGGGLYIFNSAPTLTNNTICGNSSGYGGGLYCVEQSYLTLTNSIISRNSATEDGGGMYLFGSSCYVLTNNTITSNTGGGIYGTIEMSSCVDQTITNCILWGNSEYDLGGPKNMMVTYSDIGVGYIDGKGNISADPMFVNPSVADYHLKASSPCIDAGSNSAPGLPETDFDGNPRLVDGDDNGIAIVDMGAFEATVGSTPPGQGVFVEPVDPVTGETPATLTFDEVTNGGVTTVTSTTPSEEQGAPEGFMFGSPPVIYEVTTTAVYSGNIKVCFDYSGISYGNEAKLKLFHRTDGGWVDITTSVDTVNKIICGTVTSLSYFAACEAEFVDPVMLLGELAGKVFGLNVQNGIENSLDAKLGAALQALEDVNANNDVAAINSLEAFINAVQAQSGNKIPTADADTLIAAAQEIIAVLSSM
jgi:parallel beta-helix repeat protein/predicted outer membrane repeat protein